MLWYQQANHEAQNIRVIKNMSITIFIYFGKEKNTRPQRMEQLPTVVFKFKSESKL